MVYASSVVNGHRYSYIGGDTSRDIRQGLERLVGNSEFSRKELWQMITSGEYSAALVFASETEKDSAIIGNARPYLVLEALHGKGSTVVLETGVDLSEGGLGYGEKMPEGYDPKAPVPKPEGSIFTFDNRPQSVFQQARLRHDDRKTFSRLSTNEAKLANSFKYLSKVLMHFDSIIRSVVTSDDMPDNYDASVPLLKPDILLYEQPVVHIHKDGTRSILDKPVSFHINEKDGTNTISSYAQPDDGLGISDKAKTKPDRDGHVPAFAMEFGGADCRRDSLSRNIRQFMEDHAPGLCAWSSVFENLKLPEIMIFANDKDIEAKRNTRLDFWNRGIGGKLYPTDDRLKALTQISKQVKSADPEYNFSVPKSLGHALLLLEQERKDKMIELATPKEFDLTSPDQVLRNAGIADLAVSQIGEDLDTTIQDGFGRLTSGLELDIFRAAQAGKSFEDDPAPRAINKNGRTAQLHALGREETSGLCFNEIRFEDDAKTRELYVSSQEMNAEAKVKCRPGDTLLRLVYKNGMLNSAERTVRFKTEEGLPVALTLTYKPQSLQKQKTLEAKLSYKEDNGGSVKTYRLQFDHKGAVSSRNGQSLLRQDQLQKPKDRFLGATHADA